MLSNVAADMAGPWNGHRIGREMQQEDRDVRNESSGSCNRFVYVGESGKCKCKTGQSRVRIRNSSTHRPIAVWFAQDRGEKDIELACRELWAK